MRVQQVTWFVAWAENTACLLTTHSFILAEFADRNVRQSYKLQVFFYEGLYKSMPDFFWASQAADKGLYLRYITDYLKGKFSTKDVFFHKVNGTVYFNFVTFCGSISHEIWNKKESRICENESSKKHSRKKKKKKTYFLPKKTISQFYCDTISRGILASWSQKV